MHGQRGSLRPGVKDFAFIFKLLMFYSKSSIRYSSFSIHCLWDELKSFANSLIDDVPKIDAILAECTKKPEGKKVVWHRDDIFKTWNHKIFKKSFYKPHKPELFLGNLQISD